MVRRVNLILQVVRDVMLLIVTLVLMSTSYGKWNPPVNEPAHLVLFGMAALLFVLSAVNVALLAARVRNRGFYFFNSIFQLLPAFLITGLGLFVLGIPMFVLNIAILITLRQRKHEQPSQS